MFAIALFLALAQPYAPGDEARVEFDSCKGSECAPAADAAADAPACEPGNCGPLEADDNDAAVAGLATAADGLPVYTFEEFQSLTTAWKKCALDNALRAAEFTDDPSNVVVEVAMTICDDEMSNAEFAYRRVLATSPYSPRPDDDAAAKAAETFKEYEADERKYLLTKVSFARQKQGMDSAREALRARQ